MKDPLHLLHRQKAPRPPSPVPQTSWRTRRAGGEGVGRLHKAPMSLNLQDWATPPPPLRPKHPTSEMMLASFKPQRRGHHGKPGLRGQNGTDYKATGEVRSVNIGPVNPWPALVPRQQRTSRPIQMASRTISSNDWLPHKWGEFYLLLHLLIIADHMAVTAIWPTASKP